MTTFLPRGYLEIPQAVARAADAWTEGKYSKLELTENNRDRLNKYRSAVAAVEQRDRVINDALRRGRIQDDPPPLNDEILSAAQATEDIRGLLASEKERKDLFNGAWRRLRQELYVGAVPGYIYFPPSGKTEIAPPHVWGQIGLELTEDDLEINIQIELEGGEITPRWCSGVARMRSDEMDAFLAGRIMAPLNNQASLSEISSFNEPTRVGRPPKLGIDDFWIEAARMVYEAKQGARGQTQDAFIDAMMAWGAKQPAQMRYARDTVEGKIKKLWKALKLGG